MTLLTTLAQALRREADGRALVLLDEVGTGTDPVEGAALGAALLRALAADGGRSAAFTLATTHHRCGCGAAPVALPSCLRLRCTVPAARPHIAQRTDRRLTGAPGCPLSSLWLIT